MSASEHPTPTTDEVAEAAFQQIKFLIEPATHDMVLKILKHLLHVTDAKAYNRGKREADPLPATSIDRYKAMLEHINHVKSLERYVSDAKLREAYLLSTLKAVQFEEQETDCLTSHCRDLVNQAIVSYEKRDDLQKGLATAYRLATGLELSLIFDVDCTILEKWRQLVDLLHPYAEGG